jgi:hypothetical protein
MALTIAHPIEKAQFRQQVYREEILEIQKSIDERRFGTLSEKIPIIDFDHAQ